MKTELLEHDVNRGVARIRFSHKDVVHTQTYDLGLVVPGTLRALSESGEQFTLALQKEVIEKLEAQVQREIDAGIICNPI